MYLFPVRSGEMNSLLTSGIDLEPGFLFTIPNPAVLLLSLKPGINRRPAAMKIHRFTRFNPGIVPFWI